MGKMAYNMEMHADDEFTVAFDYASGATTERFQNPLWFVTEAVAGSADLRRALATVKAFGRRIVSTAVADRQTQHGHSHGPTAAVSHLSQGAAKSSTDGADADAHADADADTDIKINEVSGSLIQSLLDAISDEDVVADAALNYLSAGTDQPRPVPPPPLAPCPRITSS